MWWFWRLSPAPKKRFPDLELPWSYLQADRDEEALDEAPEYAESSHLRTSSTRWFGALRHGMGLIEKHLRAQKMPDDGHLIEAPIGAMRALKISSMIAKPGARRATKRVMWLTPPVEQFCDLTKHFKRELLVRELGLHGDYTYWINRDVFLASGEFLKGGLAGLHRVTARGEHPAHRDLEAYASHDVAPGVVKAADLPKAEHEIADYLMVALDSYLERGPDPRFNPRSKR